MLCPSCGKEFKHSVKHCTHCGITLSARGVEIAQVVLNLAWVARRSLGGFFAAGTGWVLAVAVSRALYFAESGEITFSALLNLFPGTSPAATAIAGAFVGTVGGMIERSAYKCFLGGMLGAAGGFVGGAAYPIFERVFVGYKYAYSFSMAASWSLTASLVGLTSGMLEGTPKKIVAGLAGGFLGGALGGGVGSQIYGAILMEVRSAESLGWGMGRVLEFLGGGIVGLHVWFFVGLIEKLYIFKRRRLVSAAHKVCDSCSAENELSAWYCAVCGSALQEAAASHQIKVTPYRGLERISNAFQFLSWLSTVGGVVATVVLLVAFIHQNFLFAVFGALLNVLGIYIVSIVLRAVSEGILISMKLAEGNKTT